MNDISGSADVNKKIRLSELDALRGIAVFAVVLFHFTFAYDNGYNELSPEKFYFRYGYLGVYLFFMISGFVIFMTLEKTKDTKSFVISRFSRLYPVYWACILLTIFLTTLLSTTPHKNLYSVNQVLVNFTMFQYWFRIEDVDHVYWSLAVELTFYLIMWFIFKIKKMNYIQWIGLAWLIFSFVILKFNIPFKNYLNVIFILQYSPLFVAGMLFYQLKKGRRDPLLHILIVISLLLEWFVIYHLKPVFYLKDFEGLTQYAIVFTFFFAFYLFVYNRLTFISNKILLFLGAISYSLYLIHQNIGFALLYWLKKIFNHQIFYIPIAIATVVTLAYIIHILVEKPAMNKIRSYYKKQSPSV